MDYSLIYGYTNGLLTQVNNNDGLKINYEYDDCNNITKVKINDQLIVQMSTSEEDITYTNNNVSITEKGTIKTIDYFDENEVSIKKVYDKKGNLIESGYIRRGIYSPKIKYYYDEKGQLVTIDDEITLKQSNFSYNDDKLLSSSETDTIETNYSYNQNKLISQLTRNFTDSNSFTYNYAYSYNQNPYLCTSYSYNNFIFNYDYDLLERIKEKKTSYNGNVLLKEKYGYVKDGDQTFNLINHLQVAILNKTKDDYQYVYDKNGNIKTFKNQTCKFDNFHKINQIGENNFTYNALGCRTRKNSIYYDYDAQGLLCKEQSNHTIIYHYENNRICSINVDGKDYLLRRNLLQDVTHIYDVDGNLCAMYRYDAWGNHKVYNEFGVENSDVDFIGNINPIRYRGYYFDKETGLYYCNSRYYSPELCRWISPDSIEYLYPQSINGLNLYCYCMNNPIMYADPSGHAAISLLAVLIIGGLVSWGLSELFGEHLVTGTGLAITGGSAVVSGIMAMTLATPVGWIVGGITAVAGIFTLAFASAELQQHFTGDNWMLDGGMSEGVYYTLMTISSITASVGTAASSVAYHYKINAVTQKGRINGKMVSGTDIDGYPGLRFSSKTGKVYSLEFHPNHNGHGVHIQWNQWFTTYPKFPGEYVLNPLWRLRLW